MRRWTNARGLLAATAIALAGFGVFSAPAMARTNYAMLVAVTEYPNLQKKDWLIGPNNDAALVREYLTTRAPVKFEPQNVTLLASNLEGSNGVPTRSFILEKLAELAGKVQRDDFVYLHFSGHGAQEPAAVPGSETDGLDEIFLPADTGMWDKQMKGLPNVLKDDDIGKSLDALRDKGAFVWVIFDACHSGSATRAANLDPGVETQRKLEFSDLGVPEADVEAAVAAAKAPSEDEAASRSAGFMLGADPDAPVTGVSGQAVPGQAAPASAEALGKGGMVAFFAAQTVETTPEMPLPKGQAEAQKFGLFTFTIFQKLAENPNISYRQLGHAVLQQYSADSRPRPTPLFEGELDRRVFGTEGMEVGQQWPMEVRENGASVPAGLLHRVASGTKLAILPSPLSTLEQAVGYVEVTKAKNLSSEVKPVAYNGKPAMKFADFPAQAYARVAELTVDFKLRVARPADAEGLGEEVAMVNTMLDALNADPAKRFNVELVPPGAEADIRLAVMRESDLAGDGGTAMASATAADAPALWFLPSSGDIASLDEKSRPPLVVIHKDDPERLAKAAKDNLTTIFRATSLSKLAVASDYKPDKFSLQFLVKPEDSDEMYPLDGSSVPFVRPGDEIHVKAENKSGKLVDVNILYIGSDYSITHIDSQRLADGAVIEEGLLGFTDKSFGMERMIAVLTEATPQSEIEDLRYLQQDGVPRVTRSAAVGAEAGFAAMLADIGMAPATRSAMKLGDKGGAKGGVFIFPIETAPRP